MDETPQPVLRGPGVAADEAWPDSFAGPQTDSTAQIAVNRGWHLAWESELWRACADAGRELISVRLVGEEIQIGPRWVPDTDSGCACCAEVRGRSVLAHPLVDDLAVPRSTTTTAALVYSEVLLAVLAHLDDDPLWPGEMYSVGPGAIRRHRVPRTVHCPVCSTPPPQPPPSWRPPMLVLERRPVSVADPTRAAHGAALLDRRVLHRDLVDARFGPVRPILREARAPFAMSMAVLPEAPVMGHGRAPTFPETEPVAVLEAYERLGGFPFDAAVVLHLPFTDVADHAVDPAGLGRYTAEQLAHPTSRVVPSTATTPMDWVWGHDLADGRPVMVPADVGFYQYEYAFRRARRAARAAGTAGQRRFFHESSSGCAVGSSLEEAALHALFEVAERDAFQLSWHRQVPLPHIDNGSVTDPPSRSMIELIGSRGFDLHLLAATQDIDLPVVWALAVNRRGAFPASFTSAGSGADPESAVRGALREVAQLVTMPPDWTHEDLGPMLADPWLVTELEHHVQVYTAPETLSRATASLGGPTTTLARAFPGWPGRMTRAAQGDVRGALHHVRRMFADAGMPQVVVVDQTSRDHADAGIAVAKAVVPGTLSMCFGLAQQRLTGLPRLTAALAGTVVEPASSPYDPHPFP